MHKLIWRLHSYPEAKKKLKLFYFNDTSGMSSLFGKTLSHYHLVFALVYPMWKSISCIGRRPHNFIATADRAVVVLVKEFQWDQRPQPLQNGLIHH